MRKNVLRNAAFGILWWWLLGLLSIRRAGRSRKVVSTGWILGSVRPRHIPGRLPVGAVLVSVTCMRSSIGSTITRRSCSIQVIRVPLTPRQIGLQSIDDHGSHNRSVVPRTTNTPTSSCSSIVVVMPTTIGPIKSLAFGGGRQRTRLLEDRHPPCFRWWWWWWLLL